MGPQTTPATVSRALVLLGQMFGVSLEDILQKWGIELVEDADAIVPADLEMELWDELASRSHQPSLGIRIASLPSPTYDVCEYVARNSPDLGTGWRNIMRYQRLLHSGVGFELRESGDTARLLHHPTPGVRISRHAIEAAYALLVSRFRTLTGVDFALRSVAFCLPPPEDAAPYRELFRVEVAFAQPQTELVLDRELLALPLQKADGALYQILERNAREQLERQHQPRGFSDEVRREIARLLRGDVPRVADLARRMGTSERTLHHRLKLEGTSFGELVDQARLGVAQAFLGDPTVKVVDVALLLGFSDSSAFHRAFRRWTGTTPLEYRRTLAR